MGVGILISSDGVNWTSRISKETSWLSSITWTGDQLVGIGHNDTLLTSPDGITWTSRSLGTANIVKYLTWANSKLIAICANASSPSNGVIFTSPDGITWNPGDSIKSPDLPNSVTWTGSQFVAIGTGTLTSADGITWTKARAGSPLQPSLTSAIWTGSQFVAVSHSIYTSPDGIQWTARYTYGLGGSINGIAWSGDQLVGVGASGVIVTSSLINSNIVFPHSPSYNTLYLHLSRSHLFVILPRSFQTQNTQASIYSLTGYRVAEIQSSGRNEITIPLSGLGHGTYLFEAKCVGAKVNRSFSIIE